MKGVVISSTGMHRVVDSWVFTTLFASNRLVITVPEINSPVTPAPLLTTSAATWI
jgi:hypothetical protein